MEWSFEANGKRHAVSERRGSVVDVQLWGETYLAASPSRKPGLRPDDDPNDPTKKVSTLRGKPNRQRVFVRWGEGGEASYTLDDSLPFRSGSRLSEIFLHPKRGEPEMLQLQNLDTGRWMRTDAFRELPLPRLNWVDVLAALVVGLILGGLVAGIGAEDLLARLSGIGLLPEGYFAPSPLLTLLITALPPAILPLNVLLVVWLWRRVARKRRNARVRAFWEALEKERQPERVLT